MRIIPLLLPTPYPVGPVNAYLLPGPPVTLVDCGPKTDEARAALEEGLRRASCKFEAIERLVITHGHTDHFGLAAAVAAASGARVYAHADEVPKLVGDRSFVEPARTLITEAGFPSEVADALFNVWRSFRGHLDRIAPTHLVADGDRLPLEDGSLEVLHTPGHAQGHICLWDGKTLIAGDLLLEEISPNPVIEFDLEGRRLHTLPAYLRSLHRVAALEPEVAYPGHGEPITAPAARIAEILRHHHDRKERLARMLAGRDWTLRDLAAEWFPGLDLRTLFLGLSEVMGHLDLLEEEGRITIDRRGGVLHYRVAAPDGG
ncbi:MAG: MBL fold metallo-hydrolase [Armatimonadetes bacterium]|nr:MBL fold metallo-hydrolase [Armatimonadota bacterium]